MQHPASLLKPRVKVFYSTQLRQPIPMEVIDLAALAGKDWIVCREPAENYGDFEALSGGDSRAKAHA